MLETAVPCAVTRACRTPAHDPRWVLVVAILGSSLGFIDTTVVNVALPVVQRDLRATAAGAQWVVEGYALFLSALVLVGGALGDRLGRRRVFSAGVALFAVASAACGVAPGVNALVAARCVQGIGAALLVPGSLALIGAAFPQPERGRAIGTWSAASAVTSAVGPVAGGWVVAHASWRWLFFFNVPVAVAILVLASRRVEETRDERAAGRLDWGGAALATSGLGLVVFALIDAGGHGIGARRTLVLLALGLATLVAFVLAEGKQRAPMMPLSLFRSRTFAGANLLTLLLYAALGGALYYIPFNLIQVQRVSPAAAGAALLPLVALLATMSRGTGALSARFGPRLFLFVGPEIAAAGFLLLALPDVGASYWRGFFPGILALGLGMGLTVAPLTSTVMGAVDPRHTGTASGINNAVARTAGLLAIAAFGVLLTARFDAALDAELGRMPADGPTTQVVAEQRDKLAGADLSSLGLHARSRVRAAFDRAFVGGFRAVMLTSAALAALGGLAGLVFVRRAPEPPPTET